ncbi:hypothetical protein PUP75_14890 [Pseudomonas chlororaphis]|uniref:hypothetical protein n=1 Tax=Pseudomonas chlororaphis TaxID=587753 RepID=UPI0023675E1F|nr:hypothetical protein [Pseudomonas chlororaphis]WDH56028.1 hypothetical protein PUP75_14890 [Pseudomonas chlororaphis]
MKDEKISFEEVQQIVGRLYSKALNEMKLRPEQAFAYVQDETELLHSSEAPEINIILQTAIYFVGSQFGLKLSKDSLYAQDMLELLAATYSRYDVEVLKASGVSGQKLEQLASEMESVKRMFL